MENPLAERKTWYSQYTDPTMRWIEDTYLKYFGENRTSYGIKGKVLLSSISRRLTQ